MAQPVLIINGHDYAPLVEELTITRNDLDAEGSGRDVQTGLMYRTRVASKLQIAVKFLRLQQATHRQLLADIAAVFFPVTVLDPATGQQRTVSVYVSQVPFGVQRYNKNTGAPCYDGMSVTLTEK